MSDAQSPADNPLPDQPDQLDDHQHAVEFRRLLASWLSLREAERTSLHTLARFEPADDHTFTARALLDGLQRHGRAAARFVARHACSSDSELVLWWVQSQLADSFSRDNESAAKFFRVQLIIDNAILRREAEKSSRTDPAHSGGGNGASPGPPAGPPNSRGTPPRSDGEVFTAWAECLDRLATRLDGMTFTHDALDVEEGELADLGAQAGRALLEIVVCAGGGLAQPTQTGSLSLSKDRRIDIRMEPDDRELFNRWVERVPRPFIDVVMGWGAAFRGLTPRDRAPGQLLKFWTWGGMVIFSAQCPERFASLRPSRQDFPRCAPTGRDANGKFIFTHETDLLTPAERAAWRRAQARNWADACRAVASSVRTVVASRTVQSPSAPAQLPAAPQSDGKVVQPAAVAPTVGIITALDHETAAVLAVLGEVRPIDVPGAGAGRAYWVADLPSRGGSVHHVIVAQAGMGNNKAAIRASLLLSHFPKIDVLMCGIAGGVPHPEKPDEHVRLGDIVVSNEKGVVQYDFVKRTRKRKVQKAFEEVRASAHRPSAALLEGVQTLRTESYLGKRPWEDAIQEALALLRWQRPDNGQDVLAASKDPKDLISHPVHDDRREGQPHVFHGAIASANTLLKDPLKRDALRDQFGTKAVEMEGSGIQDATWTHGVGNLVVRGICDYCDSNKNDKWQRYAAACAAGYVRALLYVMPGTKSPHSH